MNELLKSLACSGTECMCWLLILFNILAVFYLVFCSFWKVSRIVKIFGWGYSGVLICATIVTLFYHTCIYTLLATIFTGMMLMAILSIILPQQEAYPKPPKTEAAQLTIEKVQPKPQTVRPKPQTVRPKPQTVQPKPQTAQPKPQTAQPKPRTVQPKTGNHLTKTPNPYLILAVLTAGVVLGYVGLKRKKRGI